MTGCVFSQACLSLGVDFSSQTLNLLNNEKLHKFINHLYLSWINGDIIDLNTGKIDGEFPGSTIIKRRRAKPVFSDMVLLWGLPKKLKREHIRDCLNKAFGVNSVANIYRLDETTVFVHFNRAELVSEFLDWKDRLERDKDPIWVLHPLSKILEGGCVHAARYEMYKDICSSSVSEVAFSDQVEAVWINGFDCKKGCEENVSPDCQDQKKITPGSSVDTSDDQVLDSCYPFQAQMSK